MTTLQKRLAALEKLEARSMTDATLCPHLPPLVREFETDGTEVEVAVVARAAVCDCGRPRMEVHLHETETPFPVQPDGRDIFK